MSARPPVATVSIDDFERLADPIDGRRQELVCGKVVEDMVTSGDHGDCIMAIGEIMRPFVRKNRLGRITTDAGFILRSRSRTVRAPDVAFVPVGQLNAEGRLGDGISRAIPTLAVEVVSPNDLDSEVDGKVHEYLAAGIRRVWVVRPPQRTVTVHHPDGTSRTLTETATLTSDDAGFTIPGFELPVAAIFE